MVISHGPSGSALLRALEGRHPPHLSTGAVIAVGVSLALHAGLVAYLYNSKVRPMAIPEEIEGPPIVMAPMYDWPTPEPVPQDKPAVRVREAAPSTAPLTIPPLPATPSDPALPTQGQLATIVGPPFVPQIPEPIEQLSAAAKVIGDPTWISKPSASQLGKVYPRRAAAMGIAGSATLRCVVNAVGTVRDCAVVSETPGDFGFGAAAIKLSLYFRMQPKTEDGMAVDGGQVTIPLRFTID
jgi:periplasmic protein TonB